MPLITGHPRQEQIASARRGANSPLTTSRLSGRPFSRLNHRAGLMIAEASFFLVINASRLGHGASYQITAKLVKKTTERVIPYDVKLCILSRPRNMAKLSQSLILYGCSRRLFHRALGFFIQLFRVSKMGILLTLRIFRVSKCSPCSPCSAAPDLR